MGMYDSMELLGAFVLILIVVGITARSSYLIGYANGSRRNRWPNT